MSDQDFILVDEEEKESTGADEVDKEEKKDHLAVKKEEEKETEKDMRRSVSSVTDRKALRER